jgi:pimeloyl-ACP methyl ester carboxylesterase
VRLDELEEREKTAGLRAEEQDEFQAIIWPAYFADPENVMPRPPAEVCVEAFEGLVAEVGDGIEEVAAALGRGDVPYGVLAGAASPFPWGQVARASVELSPTAFLKVVPNAGHFVWYEAPGAVRATLDALSLIAQRPESPSA